MENPGFGANSAEKAQPWTSMREQTGQDDPRTQAYSELLKVKKFYHIITFTNNGGIECKE
jgi:hypothetical protein